MCIFREKGWYSTPMTIIPISLLFLQYIYIPLEDINDHSPTFNSTQYSYLLPMPFPGGIDISAAFGNIYATDVDFTNTRIDFSLDETGSKYFNVALSKTEGKKFFVMLKSKKWIDVEDNIVFSITATVSQY